MNKNNNWYKQIATPQPSPYSTLLHQPPTRCILHLSQLTINQNLKWERFSVVMVMIKEIWQGHSPDPVGDNEHMIGKVMVIQMVMGVTVWSLPYNNGAIQPVSPLHAGVRMPVMSARIESFESDVERKRNNELFSIYSPVPEGGQGGDGTLCDQAHLYMKDDRAGMGHCVTKLTCSPVCEGRPGGDGTLCDQAHLYVKDDRAVMGHRVTRLTCSPVCEGRPGGDGTPCDQTHLYLKDDRAVMGHCVTRLTCSPVCEGRPGGDGTLCDQAHLYVKDDRAVMGHRVTRLTCSPVCEGRPGGDGTLCDQAHLYVKDDRAVMGHCDQAHLYVKDDRAVMGHRVTRLTCM
ncbi:hypothetical protein RRG08_004981 [Elysia crispata]|uniref:Uncharacterized protein n=1 Tax=Elysia crispata TaxID=231223 RepID=A0AAE1ACC5_9GAST|nr:hypothetical protein RRG08_004981 [Elysia crispata]